MRQVIYFQRLTQQMPTIHGQLHPFSTAEELLKLGDQVNELNREYPGEYADAFIGLHTTLINLT